MGAEIEGFRNNVGEDMKALEEKNNMPKVVFKKDLSDNLSYAFPWYSSFMLVNGKWNMT